MSCVVLWNELIVYISGFRHLYYTTSHKNFDLTPLTTCTPAILQMVNTRTGAESSHQGAENNPPPPPQTLAEVVAQQTQILQMLAQNQMHQQQPQGRHGQPQNATYDDFTGTH